MKTAKPNGSKDIPFVNTIINTITTKETIIGVILAGGKSTRMGQDKALLPWKNTNLLNHQINIMTEVLKNYNHFILTSGDRKEKNCNRLLDLIPGHGPLSGLHSALNFAGPNSYLLLSPIDTPLMTPELLQTLLDQIDSAEAICFENFPLPLVVKVCEKTKCLAESLLRSEVKSEKSIQNFLALINTKKISLNEKIKFQFTNLNFIENYNIAHEAAHEPAL